MAKTIRTVKDVRNFLAGVNPYQLTQQSKEKLGHALPTNWQRLIEKHGHTAVFICLRKNYTIGATMRELKTAYKY